MLVRSQQSETIEVYFIVQKKWIVARLRDPTECKLYMLYLSTRHPPYSLIVTTVL